MPDLDRPPDAKRARAFTPYWVSFFIVSTVLLAVIAAGMVAGRRRQEERHAEGARLAVGQMAASFEHHLAKLAEQARLVAELPWQTGDDPQYPPALRERVLRDGVRALTSAVHHCRGVAFSEPGEKIEVALDPAEDPAMAAWLKEIGPKLTSTYQATPRLVGPMRGPGGQSLFVQVQHRPFGAVLAVLEVRRLFETLQDERPPGSRFLLMDSAGTLWVGCGSVATCQAVPRAAWENDEALRAYLTVDGTSPERKLPARLRDLVALPPGQDADIHWRELRTGDGPLTLGLLSSLSELRAQRHADLWRLLAIGAGLLLSTGVVVVFLWRQRHQEWLLRERLRHAEELNRLEHQLVRAEKLATVGVLTAGLAHELGTPLAIIRGRAEILDERTQWPEIKTILEQSDHISNTLRQVLDFSREQPVTVRPTDVLAGLRTVAELLDFRIRQKRIRVRIEPAEGPLLVAADPDQLQQVLVNLLINACDACGTEGEIALRAAVDPGLPGFVRIEVADNGCGIPAEKLDAVFDPFFTTKPKGEGTGLGLPVAASIVRNHRGQISLASSEGRGTTVTVLWPVSQEPTA